MSTELAKAKSVHWSIVFVCAFLAKIIAVKKTKKVLIVEATTLVHVADYVHRKGKVSVFFPLLLILMLVIICIRQKKKSSEN